MTIVTVRRGETVDVVDTDSPMREKVRGLCFTRAQEGWRLVSVRLMPTYLVFVWAPDNEDRPVYSVAVDEPDPDEEFVRNVVTRELARFGLVKLGGK